MNSFSVLYDKCNMFIGGIITLLAMIFGKYWFLFAFFLLLNIVDYISGTIKARKLKTESSSEGKKGISKKIWYWVIILISFIISYCFIQLGNDFLGVNLSILTALGWYTLASYIVNEIRSIVENLLVLGVKIPEIFTKGLAITEWIMKKKSEEMKLEEMEKTESK